MLKSDFSEKINHELFWIGLRRWKGAWEWYNFIAQKKFTFSKKANRKLSCGYGGNKDGFGTASCYRRLPFLVFCSRGNVFVAELSENGSFWIGLRYVGDQWVYPDGTIPSFSDWAVDQPNNCCPVQEAFSVVHIPGKGWDDRSALQMESFICKYKSECCI
ncbi:unnamed protein product [Enterobius vermicularis]|uniref:C-type lectin domain-containing protein n=1 Tax=Enterobius vermicularis TaxID=51028 RepID=A0A0N4V4W2_ENTVE|nr:unnamed protein product [Enterobius vermicularis]